MIKHMAGIATLTYDLDGAKMFPQHPPSMMNNRKVSRRLTRTATLDGGATIYDTGYSAAARTLTLVTDISYLDWMERIVKTYSLVLVSTEEGLFKGAPRSSRIRNGRVEIDILVKEAIT